LLWQVSETLKLSDVEFAEEMKFLVVAKLYELGKISSGKAAKLAGLDRVSFLRKTWSLQNTCNKCSVGRDRKRGCIRINY